MSKMISLLKNVYITFYIFQMIVRHFFLLCFINKINTHFYQHKFILQLLSNIKNLTVTDQKIQDLQSVLSQLHCKQFSNKLLNNSLWLKKLSVLKNYRPWKFLALYSKKYYYFFVNLWKITISSITV